MSSQDETSNCFCFFVLQKRARGGRERKNGKGEREKEGKQEILEKIKQLGLIKKSSEAHFYFLFTSPASPA